MIGLHPLAHHIRATSTDSIVRMEKRVGSGVPRLCRSNQRPSNTRRRSGNSMTFDAWIQRGRTDDSDDRRRPGRTESGPTILAGEYYQTISDRALFGQAERAALPDNECIRYERKLTPENLETRRIGHPLRLSSGQDWRGKKQRARGGGEGKSQEPTDVDIKLELGMGYLTLISNDTPSFAVLADRRFGGLSPRATGEGQRSLPLTPVFECTRHREARRDRSLRWWCSFASLGS